MDWIPYLLSGAAAALSALCASMGYRRSHHIVEPRVEACAAAIADLRVSNATLLARLRKLEAAAERKEK
ncbi:MAG: hypothetical protein AAB223_03580 [Pseudomonadota bacterium]